MFPQKGRQKMYHPQSLWFFSTSDHSELFCHVSATFETTALTKLNICMTGVNVKDDTTACKPPASDGSRNVVQRPSTSKWNTNALQVKEI